MPEQVLLNPQFEIRRRRKKCGYAFTCVHEDPGAICLSDTLKKNMKAAGFDVGLAVRFGHDKDRSKPFVIVSQHPRSDTSAQSLEVRAIGLVNKFADDIVGSISTAPATVPVAKASKALATATA